MDSSAENRRQQILELISANGKVRVSQLSNMFGISEVTARIDLTELERDGLVERVHGGAVSTNRAYYNLSFQERISKYEAEKRAVATEAAKMIGNNDTVMINAGTTTFFVAQQLMHLKSLKVVTNSIAVAEELAHIPNYTVILLGGNYDSQYRFTYGEDTVLQLKKYRTDKLILSVDGVSGEFGLTTFHHQEAGVCRAMLECANHTIVIADFSKIGRNKFMHIAPVEAADFLITNNTADPDEVAAISERGLDTRLV